MDGQKIRNISLLSIFVATAVLMGSFISSTPGIAETLGLDQNKDKEGCTTILVGKDATADGSVIVAHNEDMGSYSGRLLYFPRQTHEESEIYVNYVTIPQVPETYAFWVTGNSEPVAETHYDGGWVLPGMNEYGVILCDNTINTKEELIPGGTPGTLLRYEFRKLILERAKTAREGVDLIAYFIDTYGQSGNCVCAIIIADPNEIWLVELTPRHWVARRIPDDSFHIKANQITIETEWDLASDDLIDYAVARGWYDPFSGEPFNFKKVYGKNLESAYNVSREWQGQYMLQNKVGEITVKNVLSVLTLPPAQSHGTQSFEVFHLRRHIPIEIGGLMWFGMSSGNTSVMVPIYVGSSEVPDEYTFAEYEYDPVSAWWQFELIQQLVYPRRWEYTDAYLDVRERLNIFQESVFKKTAKVEERALKLYDQGKTEKAKQLLSRYTYEQLEHALALTHSIAK